MNDERIERTGGKGPPRVYRTRGEPPLSEEIREVSDQVGVLVRDHVELAKLEMKQSAKAMGRDAGLTGAGAGMLLLGYVLLMFAAGYALATLVGLGWAFLIVAAVHLVVGGALVAVFSRKLREPKAALNRTTDELKKDRRFLGELGEEMRHGPH